LDEKRTPVIAGLGGAALVAAFMSMGGSSSPPDAGTKATSAAVAQSSDSQMEMTSNQEGPWYAFCQEYATTEFDQGKDPPQERGIKGHRVPEEAEDGTVEVTRKIKNGTEEEKFSVRKHMVGDLPTCVVPNAKLRVAIAMVPDPNATQMPLEFDRDIEAIQAAAAAEHYNYTRFWFPWRSADWTPDKTADPEAEVRRREEPGILCFRKNDHTGGQERLFVLLVGETPTSGANRIQLAHALYYRQQLRGTDEKGDKIVDPDREVVNIAGPHFSASFKAIQDVMALAVYRAGAPVPVVNLVSPDATGQEYLEEFWDFCSKQRPKCTLRTVSLSSQTVTWIAIDYLTKLGYHPAHIAQWSESESAFGDREFNDPGHAYGLTLQFPRDLSSARSRSDEQSAKVAESGSKYFALPSISPPTQLTAREPTDRDSPAAFGAEQEASQVARSLADSLQEMRAHRIGAVVINATNPLDRIYLLEYLHNQLPDVRVVTTEADELELDRPHFVDLTGTIAVTALPTPTGLRNVIQSSVPPGGDSRQPLQTTRAPMTFKSSRQEGEFLAVETLLDSNQAAGSWPDPPPCYYISVVAESGFRLLPYLSSGKNSGPLVFPCNVSTGLPDHPGDAATYSPPAMYFTVREHARVSKSFLIFLVFLVLLNILHFRCVAASRRCIDRPLSYPRPLVPSLEPDRLYLLFALNNQVALLNTMAATICYAVLTATERNDPHDWWLIVLFWCVLPLAVVSLGFSDYLLILFLQRVRRPGAEKNEIAASLGQMAVALVFLCWSIWMMLSLPALRKSNIIFLERLTSLNDGLSPVLPIAAILLGYFLWGFVQLKRLGWAASRKADLDVSPGIEEYFQSRIKSLQAKLNARDPAKKGVLVIGLLFILIAFLLWNSLNGFDGNGFRLWLVVWGVVMLLLTVVMTCLHAWSIWDDLRKLLDWMETTPLRETFKQLGSDGLLQIKIWDLAKPQRSFTVLSRTVDVIEQIDGEDSDHAKEADRQLKFFLRADATHRQIPRGRIDLLNHALNVHIDDAISSIYGADRVGRTEELRRYLALRVVALIRYAMLQIGTLTCFVAYGYVLAVVSVMFYSFEGRQALNALVVGTFVALLIWIGMMMAQFQRNGMLSRLEGSIPGQVSYGQLALHLLSVGGLPLLAIVTSQFPAVAELAFSFFRPVLGR
jgi:hypothetical protein